MTIRSPLGRVALPRWQVALALVMAVAGFVIATQVRTERAIRQQLNVPSTRLAELAILLQGQEKRRASLESQVGELRALVAQSERAAVEGQGGLSRMNRQLRDLRMLAGLVGLEGPGVIIELRDSDQPIREGEDPNKTILHYTDIQAVLNDLWSAGADAIAVNGERIMARTGVNCVGTTILCNTKRLAPPYRLVAIGDPERLQTFLERPEGPLNVLRSFGFPVSVKPGGSVSVPAFHGITEFRYAKLPGATPTGTP